MNSDEYRIPRLQKTLEEVGRGMFSHKQDLYTVRSKAPETLQKREQKEYKSWKISLENSCEMLFLTRHTHYNLNTYSKIIHIC